MDISYERSHYIYATLYTITNITNRTESYIIDTFSKQIAILSVDKTLTGMITL